jgi:hypothetical protein
VLRYHRVSPRAALIGLLALAAAAFPQGIGGRAHDLPPSTVAKAGPASRLPDGKPDLGNG